MSTPNPIPSEPTPSAPSAPATPAATTATAAPVSQPPAAPSNPASPPNNVVQLWPDTWRQNITTDEKELKQLERYATPADIWRKARSLEQKMSSGELRSNVPFPDKGTPEEQQAWRQERGIPDSHDKYDLTLSDGLVIGESDKPIIDSFLKSAHAKNIPGEFVKASVEWYFEAQQKMAEHQAEMDKSYKQQAEDTLRSEWGAEYRASVNNISGLLDMAPEGVKDNLLGARLSDGSLLANDPNTLRWLANLSRQINPITTLVPGAGANAINSINDEIAKWEGMMGNRNSEYWKGPNADKNQARYRELISARDRASKK